MNLKELEVTAHVLYQPEAVALAGLATHWVDTHATYGRGGFWLGWQQRRHTDVEHVLSAVLPAGDVHLKKSRLPRKRAADVTHFHVSCYGGTIESVCPGMRYWPDGTLVCVLPAEGGSFIIGFGAERVYPLLKVASTENTRGITRDFCHVMAQGLRELRPHDKALRHSCEVVWHEEEMEATPTGAAAADYDEQSSLLARGRLAKPLRLDRIEQWVHDQFRDRKVPEISAWATWLSDNSDSDLDTEYDTHEYLVNVVGADGLGVGKVKP